MTYRELPAVRGIALKSAERLARRKHWPRQLGNDGIIRVLVPLTDAGQNSKKSPPDVRRMIRALERALTAEKERAERAEQREMEGGQRIAELTLALTVAQAKAAALRAQVDERQDWRLLRRLRWALRGS